MDDTDISTKTNTKIMNTGPWLHAWYDPLAGTGNSLCDGIESKELRVLMSLL